MASERHAHRPAPWLQRLTSRYRRHVVAALCLGLVASGFAALLMFVSGYLISRTAQAGVTLFMVMVPVAFVQVFGIGRPLARYLERLISHDWVFRITSDIRLELFGAVARLAGDPAEQRSVGTYLGVLSDDIGHLQNMYLRVAFPVAVALLLFVAGTVFCGVFSLSIGIVFALVGLACVLALPLAARFLTRPLMSKAKSLRASEYETLSDDVMGAQDWTLAGRGAEVARLHGQGSLQHQQLSLAQRGRLRIVELASTLIMGLGTCAILMLAAGAFGGDANQANYIAAFALGAFPLIEAFVVVPSAFADATAHAESLARLDEIIGAGEPAAAHEGAPRAEEPPAAASVSIEGVSYRYPGSPADALTGIDLAIPAGEHVAVLGRSGSGKTTLASLLRGAWEPAEGSVRFRDSDGSEIDFDTRELVSYIPQNPYVFDRSLRDNLRMACPAATDERLLEVLAQVGLDERVSTLSHGLSTRIGDTGEGLSGGEAHRVALARALVANTPIIVFDEPFAALDTKTERQLLDTFFEACKDKTLIVITHHLAGIERFDRVLFIEGGRLELDGSPAELSRSAPKYQELLAFDRPS